MKKIGLGIGIGIIISMLCFAVFFFWRPISKPVEVNGSEPKNMTYAYVDFKYNELVLYDIGVRIDNELYVRPDKLMTFMGKEIQYDDDGKEVVITERPENSVINSSTAALGQTNQKTVGDMLSKQFSDQHWEADPEVEGKLIFSGVDNLKDHYEIVFLINKTKEMAIQAIYINGSEILEESKTQKIKELFGKNK